MQNPTVQHTTDLQNKSAINSDPSDLSNTEVFD